MADPIHTYDVALSFAGEDRPYVEKVALILRNRGIRVFYDDFEQANLWGKDLYVHLREIYQKRSRFTVMFISRHYAEKRWPNHERESAQARAFAEQGEYILPARFDDTEVPGLTPTTGYIDLRRTSTARLADLIAQKLLNSRKPLDQWSQPEHVFIMHAALRGTRNLDYTVNQKRDRREIARALPKGSPEREYFLESEALDRAFPTGKFNCWGVPRAAIPSFRRTNVGDLVVFVGSIGEGAAIRQIGVVKAKCPIECPEASRILWPEAKEGKTYPLLFFFDTEIGFRSWDDFVHDIGDPGYNPRGWYKQIPDKFFTLRGGPAEYLRFLREKHGFAKMSGS